MFVTLFVSISDANAHANHNHEAEKTVVHHDMTPSHKAEHQSLDDGQTDAHINCPFSCCDIACAVCCVVTNSNDQIAETNLNASTQMFLLYQQQLHKHITYSDSPPPRS